MNRRHFLSLISAGIAGIALEQAIPLGRVWSFPQEIVVPWYEMELDEFGGLSPKFPIGSTIRVRFPQRFLVRRMINQHLYEVTPDPPSYPYKIIESFVATAAFPPDSSHKPS